MTPTMRAEMTDNVRRMRAAELRDPVENALFAFMSLSASDKLAMVSKFNDIEQGRAHPDQLSYTPAVLP